MSIKNIEVLKESPTWLMCKKCGEVWNPSARANLRFDKTPWLCPNERIHR